MFTKQRDSEMVINYLCVLFNSTDGHREYEALPCQLGIGHPDFHIAEKAEGFLGHLLAAFKHKPNFEVYINHRKNVLIKAPSDQEELVTKVLTAYRHLDQDNPIELELF